MGSWEDKQAPRRPLLATSGKALERSYRAPRPDLEESMGFIANISRGEFFYERLNKRREQKSPVLSSRVEFAGCDGDAVAVAVGSSTREQPRRRSRASVSR